MDGSTGMTIMMHNKDNPILTLGFGKFDAFEHAGNFDITDEVTDLEDFEPKGKAIDIKYHTTLHLQLFFIVVIETM